MYALCVDGTVNTWFCVEVFYVLKIYVCINFHSFVLSKYSFCVSLKLQRSKI